METTSNPTVSLFGIDFDLTVLAMSLLTVIIVFGVVFWSSRKMTIKPTIPSYAPNEHFGTINQPCFIGLAFVW